MLVMRSLAITRFDFIESYAQSESSINACLPFAFCNICMLSLCAAWEQKSQTACAVVLLFDILPGSLSVVVHSPVVVWNNARSAYSADLARSHLAVGVRIVHRMASLWRAE